MRQHRFVSLPKGVLARAVIGFLTTLVLFLVFGAGAPSVKAEKPPQDFVDETKLPFTALAGTTTTRLWGVHGGAGYRIEVPENWNGDLVLYAHGFRGAGLELTVSNPPFRAYLIQHGFAWAASSYATNGYDVTQGVKDTHGLGNRFNGLVGESEPRVLHGHVHGRPYHGRGHRAVSQRLRRRDADVRRDGRQQALRLLRREPSGRSCARRPRRAVPVPGRLHGHHRASAQDRVRRCRSHQVWTPLGAEVRRRRGEPERRRSSDVRAGVPLFEHGRQLPARAGRRFCRRDPDQYGDRLPDRQRPRAVGRGAGPERHHPPHRPGPAGQA